MSFAKQQRDLIVRIDAETRGLEGGVARSSAALRGMQGELRKLEARQAKTNQAMDQVGKAGLAMGAAAAAGLALAVRAAAQWESQWAGVEKVTEGNAAQMKALEGELRQLAKTLPASHKEIAAVAEAAGQLGIKRQDVAAFTETMIALQASTNLTADQAATSLARMANIMGTVPADVDRMGAALVALGNDGASTEAEILEMATRIASAGKQIGLSEADVMAFANAMSSVGIEAEAGGSSISRVFIDMRNAVMSGGDDLDTFASTAGQSASEFRAAFEQDAGQAVVGFIEGLARLESQGQNSNDVLGELGLTDIRVGNTLRAAAGAGDLFRDSLVTGAEAWEQNTALTDEANKRYETTEAKLKVAKNAVSDLAITLGGPFLDALGAGADATVSMANGLESMPGPVREALTVLGSLAATVGLVGGAALIAVPKIVEFRAAMTTLGVTAAATRARLAAAAAFMAGPWGAAAIVATALVLNFAKAKADATARTNEYIQALNDDSGAMDENTRALAARRLEEAGAYKEAERMGIALDLVTRAALGNTKAQGQVAEQVRDSGRLNTGLTETIEAEALALDSAKASLERQAEATKASAEASGGAESAAAKHAEAVGGVVTAVDNAYSSLAAFAESQGYSEEATEDLTKTIEAWAESLASVVQPLGAYQSVLTEKEDAERESAEATAAATESQKDSWEDYADAVDVSVGEYLDRLEEQVAAQQEWSTNMLLLAGRVSEGTLEELARLGPEGAPLVADLVGASDTELARLEAAFATRSKGATGAMAAEWKLAQPVLTAIAAALGRDTADSLARQLAAGTTTVAQIAAQYGAVLAGGINPILTSLGRQRIATGLGGSGGTTKYAEGGFEDHRAQIAPAGAWRVWAEPETGGESYIPLAPAKRPRSRDIWRETGRRLGVEFAEFAAGGFHAGSDVPRPYSTAPFRAPISTAGDGTMGAGYAAAVAFLAENAFTGPVGAALGRGGVNAELLRRFDAWNASQGGRLRINSGRRDSRQQAVLYARYLAGLGPIAARPGTSKHEQGLAIDYGPASWGLTATARRFGMKAPVPSEAWHLEPMAKGGILNPHVRDRGGPLQPGYTLNGTGRPEMVLPMAVGGITRPVPGGQSLSQYAATMASPQDLTALLKQWDRYLEQLEQAARRTELLAAVQRGEADALQRLREFDVAAYRQSETDAVDRLIESLEREQKAREAALDTAKDADAQARRAADDALEALDRLLDQQVAVQRKQAQAAERFAQDRLRVTERLVQAEADLYRRQADATSRFAEQEQQVLTGRRDRLAGAFGADQIADFTRGLPARWLVANVEQQVEDLAQWASQLDLARRMGVSEQVIEALGLDEGPQALYQVRALTSSTAAELDALNAAVAARSRVAGERARSEAAAGLGQLGADLAEAQAELTGAQAEAFASYRQAQADAQAELESAQAEFLSEQADLAVELAAVGVEQGRSYAQAMADGLASGLPAVQAAAAALAAATERATAAQLALVAAQMTAAAPLSAGVPAAAPAPPPQVDLLSAAYAAGMTPDAYAVSQGGSVLTDRIRAIIAGAGKTAGDARVADLVAQVLAGRTLDSIRASVRRDTFDAGGWLQPGLTLAYNGTGRPEFIPPPQQTAVSTSRAVTFNNTIYLRDDVDHELLLRQQAFQVSAGAL